MKAPAGRVVESRVLDVIRQYPGLTALDIAKRLHGPGARQQRVNPYCLNLCEKGLVTRQETQKGAYIYVPTQMPQEVTSVRPQKRIDDSKPLVTAEAPSVQLTSAPCHPSINVTMQLVNLRLIPVYEIRQNQRLKKGGTRDNRNLCAACNSVKAQNLCYFWRSGERILYVGSATERKNKNSTLLSRVLNYLQTHAGDRGRVNQNKRLFDNINDQLEVSDVSLGRFECDVVTVRDFTITHEDCTRSPHMTKMIEALLIGYFRLQQQVPWNL